jgi:hypothetical protein
VTSREPFFLRMAIWLRGLERWYLVLGGVAVGRGFEPQSDLELSFAKILIKHIFFDFPGLSRIFSKVGHLYHPNQTP